MGSPGRCVSLTVPVRHNVPKAPGGQPTASEQPPDEYGGAAPMPRTQASWHRFVREQHRVAAGDAGRGGSDLVGAGSCARGTAGRRSSGVTDAGAVTERDRRRLERWRTTHGPAADDAWFTERLADLDLDPAGLTATDGRYWAIRPLGAGLADGYSGVALFLAQLGALTNVGRYRHHAWQAVRPIPRLLDELAARPERVRNLGRGIAYALARLARLLDDDVDVAGWVPLAVDLVSAATEGEHDFDVLSGDAGCLAAMLAVHDATGLSTAWTTAQACADRLAAREAAIATGGAGTQAVPAPPAGFAYGDAGAGWPPPSSAPGTARTARPCSPPAPYTGSCSRREPARRPATTRPTARRRSTRSGSRRVPRRTGCAASWPRGTC